jgi:hypothetical protein
VIGFTTEAQNAFFRTGLNYYVRAKCMWDVDANVDALLADFHKRFFGRSAEPMARFTSEIETMLAKTPDSITWQPLWTDWRPTYPAERVAALGKLLDEADRLADSPEVKNRIKLYRILHEYMTAYDQMYELERAGKYKEALAEVDQLTKCVAAAQQIQPGLLPPDPGWVLDEAQGLASIRSYIGALADRTNGKAGYLLARAPGKAQFLTDPGNVGLYEQWQRDDVAEKIQWETIPLTQDWGLSGYRDNKRYAYDSIGWYRFKMKVRKVTSGRAQLVAPQVYAEKVWVWVNGRLVCSPTNVTFDPKQVPLPGKAVAVNARGAIALAIDIQDQLHPGGDNTFTFRMMGSLVRTQHRGISDVPFVWVPQTEPR